MKSKKLLVSLAIVAVVVVIIVVLASVFSVRHIDFSYHNFEGRLTTAPDGGIPIEAIESIARGKSTIFLSKSNFLTEVNAKLRAEYPDWHAFAVVKSFPNILEIHVVKRTAIAKLTTSGETVYLDSFGCRVTNVSEDIQCLDISSAFANPVDPATEQPKDGMFKFASEENNARLSYVLQAILATWQCYVEIDEMDEVLLASNAFEFQDDSMIIHPRTGGAIRLLSPETDLTARLQKAYGVYYNSSVNLQGDDWEITVYKNGRIKTPDPNKK